MGDVPSHPELLDHLAVQFVRDGWSFKKLIRTLVLTHAYPTERPIRIEANMRHADPSNRLVFGGSKSRGRLEGEEIRDAMLAIDGALDLSRPHASRRPWTVKVKEMADNDTLAAGDSRASAQLIVRPSQRLPSAASRPDA